VLTIGTELPQRPPDARLAPHGKAHRRIRRRRSNSALPTRRPPPPPRGAVLDVPSRLPHRQLGERPATRGAQRQLVNVGQLGGGTVQIGDPSGRTTARSRQGADVQSMNVESIQRQLERLWTNVKCLGIKHQYSQMVSRKREILNNRAWLEKLSAVEMMRDLGSGMRLGAMLGRDSYVACPSYKTSSNAWAVSSYGWRAARAWRCPSSATPSSKLTTGGACTGTKESSSKSAGQTSTATSSQEWAPSVTCVRSIVWTTAQKTRETHA
jgi:hypothetical protein